MDQVETQDATHGSQRYAEQDDEGVQETLEEGRHEQIGYDNGEDEVPAEGEERAVQIVRGAGEPHGVGSGHEPRRFHGLHRSGSVAPSSDRLYNNFALDLRIR